MWKGVAAAAVLGLVPACMHAAHEPSVSMMPFPSYAGLEEFHSSVLICLGDLLAEQGLLLKQLFFSPVGKRLAGSKPVSHLFQQLDC